MNLVWCSLFKVNGVLIGVLDMEYLVIIYDWGYNGMFGLSMNSVNWYFNWGGVIRFGVFGNIMCCDYL